MIADLEARIFRGDDLADGASTHDGVDLLRRSVGFGIVHTTAHVRVERHEEMLDQDLALDRGLPSRSRRGGNWRGSAHPSDVRRERNLCCAAWEPLWSDDYRRLEQDP